MGGAATPASAVRGDASCRVCPPGCAPDGAPHIGVCGGAARRAASGARTPRRAVCPWMQAPAADLLLQVGAQRLAEANGGGALALAQRCRRDARHHHCAVQQSSAAQHPWSVLARVLCCGCGSLAGRRGAHASVAPPHVPYFPLGTSLRRSRTDSLTCTHHARANCRWAGSLGPRRSARACAHRDRSCSRCSRDEVAVRAQRARPQALLCGWARGWPCYARWNYRRRALALALWTP